MDNVKIGQFIALCRKERGMTQTQLAEQLGVSNKSVSRWENGVTMPDMSLYEPLNYGEKTALNMLATKSQLENFAILTEILIVIGIVISMTLTKLLASSFIEILMTLVCGWFVWGYGLFLRIKIKKAISKLEQN